MTALQIAYEGRLETPLGLFAVAVDERGGVVAASFLDGEHKRCWADVLRADGFALAPDGARAEPALRQLAEYFAGQRRTFTLPLAPVGTPFQQQVWAALGRIPYGTTCSYRDLANSLGNLAAIRAVGTANGANRVPVIIPCHRVVGTDGSLTGFAGGLRLKRWLLEHEGSLSRTLFA